ncbi:MAG: sensory histidine kinase AtoS [Methanomassiliicoccales archaeon PtaU1.Bin030]|nr:MAG: sensory histidine kinase AtoS [Methanomassiliicoccales archaeon PtaU1.Bin030]
MQVLLFSIACILLLFFDLEYAGKGRWMTVRNVILVSLVPAASMALYWTNDQHHLFYNWVRFDVVQDTVEIYTDYATAFFVLYLYIHVLTIVGSLFVFYLFSNTPRTQKKQTGIVLAASCLPWLVSTGEVTFYMSGSYLDILMNFASLTLAACLYYIGTFTFKHSDVTALSYDAVVENMDDGVIIIDSDGALGYANSKAREVLGLSPEIMGKQAENVLAPLGLGPFCDGHAASSHEKWLNERVFNVKTRQIPGTRGEVQGHLITVRDVTEERKAKESLRLANDKLNLLSMVARHDMMNKLVVQRGYLELAGLNDGGTMTEERRRIMLANVEDMENIMIFTRDYQSLGLKSPEWQPLDPVVKEAERTVHPPGIDVRIDAGNVELYADLMLQKVFTNLLDNSVRHGERVSLVRVWTEENQDLSLSVFYEDNGVGVPIGEKEKIFELGHGRNTGLGMYLSRQILGITGSSMREKGRAGEGCIFEILVPAGKWRRAS